jgi:Domain of unknown function (DUF4386)
MSATALARSPGQVSPRVLARIYGGIGLFGIGAGFFDIGYVHDHVMAGGDAAATMHNLLAYQTLFRSGIALHLLMVLLNVVGEVIAFYIFRRVNPLLATMALCCGLVGGATEGIDMLGSVLPLQIAGGHALGAFSAAQRDVMSYLSLQLQHAGLLLSFLFWGLDEVLLGYLIFRSGFLPRTLGVLLAISGILYLSDPLLTFGAPALAAPIFPAALALCLPGEFLSALWMAAVGLNAAKWREWREPVGVTLPA